MVVKLFYFLIVIFLPVLQTTPLLKSGGVLPNGGKIWALLVAGSSGYANYRHQADICHTYQMLHKNGIPDDQIIVMMVDDIAFNPENPIQGEIINQPGGPNVYPGVLKDFTQNNVNPEVFLNVLKGNSTGVNGIGSGRVIESGPKDHIFVNFVDHGSPYYLNFPNAPLYADELLAVINTMVLEKRFDMMVFFVEACYSGSMFDNLLPDDLNVFAMTAADPHESSYAIYYDDVRNTYLGDVFSELWVGNAEQETGVNSLHHLFERVRTFTNTSHVEEYGELNVGDSKTRDFIGFQMQEGQLKTSSGEHENLEISEKDVVDNVDIPIALFEKKINNETDPIKVGVLKKRIQAIKKVRNHIDKVFERILSLAVPEYLRFPMEIRKSVLAKENYQCYKNVINKLSSTCFNVNKHLYSRVHFNKLVNMCTSPDVKTTTILHAIDKACIKKLDYDY